MGVELEYKFTAQPDTLKRIAEAFGPFREIKMQTTYFDTPSRSLARRNCTLRLRMENDVCICTLKTPLPNGSRAEWECEAATIEEGLAKLPQAAALVDGPLEAVCGARFTRLACNTPSAELALDRGVLLGGGKELPLCEVEVEHKQGEESESLAFAQVLARQFGLQEEHRSKFARASALAKGEYHG